MTFSRFRILVIGLLAVSACRFPPPTHPESSQNNTPAGKELPKNSPEELQRQINELKADQQSANEDIDQKVRSVQDKADIIQHDFEQDQKKNESIHSDFDGRLAALEKKMGEMDGRASVQSPVATPSAGITAPGTSSTQPYVSSSLVPEKNVSTNSEQQYQAILDSLLEQKDYDRAIRDFKTFMQKYPEDPLKANAQYWIAEAHFSKKDYAKAITEFQKVIDQYPGSSKKCDSLLKQGMAFSNMKDKDNAKLFLTETKNQCSGTEIGQKATKLLQNIK